MKKYDWYWVVKITVWGLIYGMALYVIVCTILAMLQHGTQPWNMWYLIAEGVHR